MVRCRGWLTTRVIPFSVQVTNRAVVSLFVSLNTHPVQTEKVENLTGNIRLVWRPVPKYLE
jgi:hypothetical protein